jgi:ABC-type Mn2+/Zn2+ transport system permease subunit
VSLVSVAVGFLVTTLILKTSSVGPTIVIVSVLVFIMSLLKKKRRANDSAKSARLTLFE